MLHSHRAEHRASPGEVLRENSARGLEARRVRHVLPGRLQLLAAVEQVGGPDEVVEPVEGLGDGRNHVVEAAVALLEPARLREDLGGDGKSWASWTSPPRSASTASCE